MCASLLGEDWIGRMGMIYEHDDSDHAYIAGVQQRGIRHVTCYLDGK